MQSRPRTKERLRPRRRRPPGGAARTVPSPYHPRGQEADLSFIETDKAECMLSVLINTQLRIAARDANVRRFFSNSACAYNAEKQVDTNVIALKESGAYTAVPGGGYRR